MTPTYKTKKRSGVIVRAKDDETTIGIFVGRAVEYICDGHYRQPFVGQEIKVERADDDFAGTVDATVVGFVYEVQEIEDDYDD